MKGGEIWASHFSYQSWCCLGSPDLISSSQCTPSRTYSSIRVSRCWRSLEIYAAGFVITFPLQSHGAVPFIDDAPAFALMVTDDRGGQYPFQPSGATGAAIRQSLLPVRCIWRLRTSPGTALMQRGNGSSPPAS